MNKTFLPYIVGYALLLVVMVVLLSTYPKAELHLMLNSCHSAFGDIFFRYYSILGEWPLYLIALIPLCYRKYTWTAFYALCELLSAGVVQTLKHIFHAPRPVSFFEDYPDMALPVVDGVHLHHSNSFPSGHTATFFIFFTFFALLLSQYYAKRKEQYYAKRKEQSSVNIPLQYLSVFIMLVCATLGGYSRIYLSQHFLSDVCVGSIIGVTIPCLVFAKYSNKIVK